MCRRRSPSRPFSRFPRRISPRILPSWSLTPSFSNLCLCRGGLQSPAAGVRKPQRPRLPPGAQLGLPTASLRPRRSGLRNRWGARGRESPEGAPGAEAPVGADTAAGSSRPAAGGAAPRFRRGSFSHLSGSMLPRVRTARQRQMDYCSLPGRPPPPALQPPGKSRPILAPGARTPRSSRRPPPRAAGWARPLRFPETWGWLTVPLSP